MPDPRHSSAPAAVPASADPETVERWDRVERLAWIMDSAIAVPGTDRRIGADGLLGLIPGIGDAASFGVAGLIVVEGVRLGARGATLVRMLLNVGVDAAMGLVPLIGWLGDFAFKANTRNVMLLRRHAVDPARTQDDSRRAVALAIVSLIGLLVLLVGAVVALVVWLGTLVL